MSTAIAQEEVCGGTFAVAEFSEAIEAVDEAITEANGALARRILDDVYDAMRCVGGLIEPEDLGHYARQTSFVAFYAQDFEEASAWAQLADETLGGDPWPDELPITAPFQDLLDELPEARLGGPENAGFLVPKKGAALVDGRFAESPEASVGVPHLLQIADKSATPVHTSWVDGMAFPESQLGNPTTVTPPKWYEEPPLPAPQPMPDAEPDPPEEPAIADADPDPTEAAPPTEEPPTEELPTEEPSPTKAPRTKPILAFDEASATRSCDWKKARHVSATGRTVTINRHTYDVRTTTEQALFRKTLRTCGEFRATRRFNRWREAKSKLAFDARSHRDSMVKAILTDEPKRRRDR